jgi:hypothetical protein
MDKKTKRVLGYVAVVIGVVMMLNTFSGITGFVAFNEEGGAIGSVIAVLLIISGIVLVMTGRDNDGGGLEGEAKKIEKIKRSIDQEIRSGKVGKYKDLVRYARRIGYDIEEGSEHMVVEDHGRTITQIPRSSGEAKKGTYQSILRDLYESVA